MIEAQLATMREKKSKSVIKPFKIKKFDKFEDCIFKLETPAGQYKAKKKGKGIQKPL